VDDIDAGDADGAGSRKDPRSADADGGGLAGAVGAEQTVQLSLVNGELDAIDGDNALFAFVDLTQALDLDDGS